MTVKLVREIYFPTLIYFADLPDGAALNEGMRPHIYALREEEPEGIVKSNMRKAGSWHSPTTLADLAQFAPLKNAVLSATRRIFEDLDYDPAYEPAISNMWTIINPRNGYNRSHVHPGSLWSGVYYVQAPPDCGRIVFSDPRAPAVMWPAPHHPTRQRKPESWTEVYFEPIEGRMLLFPAWLLHEVEPNLSELDPPAGDRIVVSFNIHQNRRAAASA
jgi:uncharacterized protein (TIGR02466 family)